ncbi:MAG: dihydrolipoamide acetyltransferase family protein [Dehalococcoidia bacterium]
MISEVVMPQMGADMEEGTVVRWMKHEGDAVERGEIIAEIETDKANVEIEAFDSGTFRKALANEGDTVPVGTIIAVIAAPEDDISKYGSSTEASKGEPAKTKASAGAPPAEAREKPPAAATPPAKAPPTRQQAPAPPRVDGRVRASPVARKLAEERGVDLTKIRGSGPDGRIVRRDVEAAATGGAPPKAEAHAAAPGPVTTVARSKMRQTIARRMALSKREAPHYYITVDIDMTEAERTRKELNETSGQDVRVSVNDLIVKASAIALQRHPIFNSWFVEDEVRQHTQINVCIAIALDDGLIAPAILDCANKSLLDVARAGKDLVERAKSGALKADEYSGGTFTISNLGPYGVETLVAIIQPPQTAILGVGAVQPKPVARDGEIVVAQVMKAALSADHRVTDGAQGARFLNEIQGLLEKPVALLI